jgi:hypothetical protein
MAVVKDQEDEDTSKELNAPENRRPKRPYSSDSFDNPAKKIAVDLLTAGIVRDLRASPLVMGLKTVKEVCMIATGDVSAVYGYQDTIANPMAIVREMEVTPLKLKGL